MALKVFLPFEEIRDMSTIKTIFNTIENITFSIGIHWISFLDVVMRHNERYNTGYMYVTIPVHSRVISYRVFIHLFCVLLREGL